MISRRILVFGNDRYACRIIRWVLEYKGYQAKSVSGPEAAIKALAKQDYELVIAKVSQGSGDTLRVIKKAKQISPETKIILMGNNHSLIFPWEAFRIEVDDYLMAPIWPNELWHRVNRCLEPGSQLPRRASRQDKSGSLKRRGGKT